MRLELKKPGVEMGSQQELSSWRLAAAVALGEESRRGRGHLVRLQRGGLPALLPPGRRVWATAEEPEPEDSDALNRLLLSVCLDRDELELLLRMCLKFES